MSPTKPQWGKTGRRVKPETLWSNIVKESIQIEFKSNCRIFKVRGGIGQERGVADLVGVVHGRGVAFELKVPGGRHKVSSEQTNFLVDWSGAGGFAMVIDSEETLRAAIEYLRALGKKGGD